MTVASATANCFETILEKLVTERTSNLKDISGLTFYAVNPPLVPEKPFDIDVAKNQGYYNFPPTGSMYLCASIDSLELANTECHVIDLNNFLLKCANLDEKDFIYNRWKDAFFGIEKDKYNVFLVSYMFGTTKECFINTVDHIKENFPDSIIISGGVQATFDKNEILADKYADLVCSNEGDLQIQSIANTIHGCLSSKFFAKDSGPHKNSGYEIHGGIYIQSSDGDVISSGDIAQPAGFDWSLDKYYSEIEIQSYYKNGGLGPFTKYVESKNGHPLPYSAVLTKRGCRAHCAFCTVRTFNGKGLRLRKIGAVLDELRYLYKAGIRHIDWLDDDLLYDESYNLELFKAISNEFPDLKWTASNGLIGVAITPELMEQMAESGLLAFKIGVESGNSEVIKDIRKPTTLWRLLDKSKLIRQYPDIFFSANFIVGFPGETFGQMMDSYIFARKLSCDWSSFYVCQPLKGTDLYSSFQHLMDPRVNDEAYSKTLNPGRSAARGEFAYSEKEDLATKIEASWNVFDISRDRTFTAEEHNEIWFTFNLVANFFANPCYDSPDLTRKLIHWLLAIHSGYPFDASMTAALSYSYNILDSKEESKKFAHLTESLITNSAYWQRRVRAFPEILTLCGFQTEAQISNLVGVDVPEQLVPDKYIQIFNSLEQLRDKRLWRD